jgi:hypothetical protein
MISPYRRNAYVAPRPIQPRWYTRFDVCLSLALWAFSVAFTWFAGWLILR